jgi:type VI secretion system protein ImpE
MNSRQLFDAGKLVAAIEALGVELRDNPNDAQRRTFLFELLCFAGNYDRAEKQLDVLAYGGPEAGMGALLYRSALHAERLRAEMFEKQTFPLDGAAAPAEISGNLNGKAFTSIEDADPRIGARLEIFAAGQYTWIPWQCVASLKLEAPKRLRDLLWSPATLRTSEDFRGQELGELLLPALAPLSFASSDDEIRLGRATDWVELEDGDFAPIGQKMLLVDGEQVPLLSIRDLEIHQAGKAAT